MNTDVANYDHQTHNELIVGTGRVGKSSLWLQHVCSHPGRKFVFDFGGQFSARVGVEPARTLVEMNEGTRRGCCVFEPSLMFQRRSVEEAFSFFCDYAFVVQSELGGPACFACDEFQLYTSTNKLPQEFATLLDIGPHYELDFFSVSRSPNLTNNRLRNQITHCYAFKATDDNALRFLAGVGFDVEQVKALPKFHYILWQRDADPALQFTRGRSERV